MNNNEMVHIFETAGLGKAPFVLQRVTCEGSSCQFCNTPIVFRFYIKGIDGKEFFVGSDCVFKTNDTGLKRVVEAEVKKRQAELRRIRDAAKLAAIRDRLTDPVVIAELAARPHPYNYSAKQGKTYKDYVDYVMRWGGKTAKLELAKVLLPTRTKTIQKTGHAFKITYQPQP